MLIQQQIARLAYQKILKPLLFLMDPEKVHDFFTATGQILGKNYISRQATKAFLTYSNSRLEQNILGVRFANPIGLAAGFDKNALLTDILPSVGFGFMEVGTITGEACEGNPRPRLWRLKKSKGLVIYYGLKNDGCEAISKRLRRKNFQIPLITSIGKTNSKETVQTNTGIKDYVKAYTSFADIGDFFDINISCPNAFGDQPFSDPDNLGKLLTEIDTIPTGKSVFLKMPPDLTDTQLDSILNVVERYKIAGFICTNLTKKKSAKIIDDFVPEKGGYSGKVVEELSNELIGKIYKKTVGKYIIIGCGGVFSAEDAYKKIKAGASLVQLITGMIFEGPQLIGEINRGLVKLMIKDGYTNISQAVGVDSIGRGENINSSA